MFGPIKDPVVQLVLDLAARELNAMELGSAYDEAHGLLAAHKLAISPHGRAARLVDDKGKTTYENEFAAVVLRAVVPLTVVGGSQIAPGGTPCP